MKFGVCGSPALARVAARAGYDYFEMSVGALLKPREEADAFGAVLAEVRTTPIPCPVVNVFIPADLKITGPVVDLKALEKFVATACQRARQAGVEVFVLGSGGARRVPEGFDHATARRQIISFCHLLGPIAARNDVTIAIEPLNLAECNILNTVAECAGIVRAVDHPAIQLLVDAYHLLKDGDSLEDVVAYGDLLVHAHIATIPGRLAPGMEPCDLAPFFQALKRGGYDGRISIEGNIPENEADLRSALELMKRLAE